MYILFYRTITELLFFLVIIQKNLNIICKLNLFKVKHLMIFKFSFNYKINFINMKFQKRKISDIKEDIHKNTYDV